MSSKWTARLALAAIYVVSAALTFGLGADSTFERLPFVLQFIAVVAAIITGAATTLIVVCGLGILVIRALS